MSNLDKLTAAQACYIVLMSREANASPDNIANARRARQEMQVHISQLRRSIRNEK